MKKAFFINGGIGRVLCAIPALEWYKQHTDPDVVIVAEGWSELFLVSPILRNNIFPAGHKGLFEEKLRDKEIITPEPYRLNAYFNQKCNLIQAFDMLINDLKDVPAPKELNVEINKVDQLHGYTLVNQVKQQLGREKTVVFQPFGSGAKKEGDVIIDPSGRSFEVQDILKIIEKLNKHYAVILMSEIDISSNVQIGVAVPQANLLQWMGIINAADYFLGCDSVGQHYAHAVDKPATVVLGSTFPENISYPYNKNFTIIDNGKSSRVYAPIRITMDFVSERINENLMKLSDKTIDQVMQSVVDVLGKPETKTPVTQVPHVHGPGCAHHAPISNKKK